MLHEALSGRRHTKLEYQHELPKLQDRLLDVQFKLCKSATRDMLALTNTRHAPWTIVPADDKRHARLAVLRGMCERIEAAL